MSASDLEVEDADITRTEWCEDCGDFADFCDGDDHDIIDVSDAALENGHKPIEIDEITDLIERIDRLEEQAETWKNVAESFAVLLNRSLDLSVEEGTAVTMDDPGLRKVAMDLSDEIQTLTTTVDELDTDPSIREPDDITKKEACRRIALDEILRKSDNYGEKAVVEAPTVENLVERDFGVDVNRQTVHDAFRDLVEQEEVLTMKPGRSGAHTPNTRISFSGLEDSDDGGSS